MSLQPSPAGVADPSATKGDVSNRCTPETTCDRWALCIPGWDHYCRSGADDIAEEADEARTDAREIAQQPQAQPEMTQMDYGVPLGDTVSGRQAEMNNGLPVGDSALDEATRLQNGDIAAALHDQAQAHREEANEQAAQARQEALRLRLEVNAERAAQERLAEGVLDTGKSGPAMGNVLPQLVEQGHPQINQLLHAQMVHRHLAPKIMQNEGIGLIDRANAAEHVREAHQKRALHDLVHFQRKVKQGQREAKGSKEGTRESTKNQLELKKNPSHATPRAVNHEVFAHAPKPAAARRPAPAPALVPDRLPKHKDLRPIQQEDCGRKMAGIEKAPLPERRENHKVEPQPAGRIVEDARPPLRAQNMVALTERDVVVAHHNEPERKIIASEVPIGFDLHRGPAAGGKGDLRAVDIPADGKGGQHKLKEEALIAVKALQAGEGGRRMLGAAGMPHEKQRAYPQMLQDDQPHIKQGEEGVPMSKALRLANGGGAQADRPVHRAGEEALKNAKSPRGAIGDAMNGHKEARDPRDHEAGQQPHDAGNKAFVVGENAMEGRREAKTALVDKGGQPQPQSQPKSGEKAPKVAKSPQAALGGGVRGHEEAHIPREKRGQEPAMKRFEKGQAIARLPRTPFAGGNDLNRRFYRDVKEVTMDPTAPRGAIGGALPDHQEPQDHRDKEGDQKLHKAGKKPFVAAKAEPAAIEGITTGRQLAKFDPPHPAGEDYFGLSRAIALSPLSPSDFKTPATPNAGRDHHQNVAHREPRDHHLEILRDLADSLEANRRQGTSFGGSGAQRKSRASHSGPDQEWQHAEGAKR